MNLKWHSEVRVRVRLGVPGRVVYMTRIQVYSYILQSLLVVLVRDAYYIQRLSLADSDSESQPEGRGNLKGSDSESGSKNLNLSLKLKPP